MTKPQYPNNNQIPMFKIPNLQVSVIGNLVTPDLFGNWCLEFVILLIGAWNL
jgi:hypothetical protein